MSDTLCVIQARTGSTRLPGKVLRDLAGVPMLEFMLRRLAPLRDCELVVATSDDARDDSVAALAEHCNVGVVRGSEHDVLSRFAVALDEHAASHVVRLTADCPLVDPELVVAVLDRHITTGADYTSNVLPRTFPKGLDVEVMRAEALRVADAEATETSEREHVTPFLYRRPERFRLANLRSGRHLGREWWTVDTAADLEWVRTIVAAVGRSDAGWREMLSIVGPHAAPPEAGVLAVRPVDASDSARLLAWRNDPDAVRWSGTGAPVTRREHAGWFAAVVDDPGRRVWIGEVDGSPVGFVRVDVVNGLATVSLAVDARWRGRGCATALLDGLHDALREDCQVTSLMALVHPQNVASKRLFAAAGYERLADPECGLDNGLERLVRGSLVPMETV